jgi:hypothetical protein
METKTNIAQAILAVMKDVKGIDKSMTVGSGNNSYKGVPDQEVKKIIGEAMEKHGLCLLPIGVDAKTKVDRWEEETTYNGVTTKKMKQSVFTEAKTRYLLLHTSGESIELEGYGQGVDAQDKSAGKSTTYALKYTLLYTFLVPTGKIDDADNTHSEDTQVPQNKVPVQVKEAPESERVANMQGRTNPELPSGISQSILDAKTQAELKTIWESNTDLQKVKKFTDAVTQRKSDLLKEGVK